MAIILIEEVLMGLDEVKVSLEQALTRFQRQGFTALEIAGEPGIGKTRLLAELARAADQRGHLVLSGAASELEADLPFCVFVDALDEYVHGLEPHRLEELGAEARAGLAHVLPSLAPLSPGPPQAERHRVHGAVRALLEQLAELTKASGPKRPAILVVGKVAALRQHLRWFDERPLFGKRIAVTRPREDAPDLSDRLAALGAIVVLVYAGAALAMRVPEVLKLRATLERAFAKRLGRA